jgi:hypothetical protein
VYFDSALDAYVCEGCGLELSPRDFVDADEDPEFDDDGQPDEYTEYQDLYGGDDWDHGQYDEVY